MPTSTDSADTPELQNPTCDSGRASGIQRFSTSCTTGRGDHGSNLIYTQVLDCAGLRGLRFLPCVPGLVHHQHVGTVRDDRVDPAVCRRVVRHLQPLLVLPAGLGGLGTAGRTGARRPLGGRARPDLQRGRFAAAGDARGLCADGLSAQDLRARRRSAPRGRGARPGTWHPVHQAARQPALQGGQPEQRLRAHRR